jgi:hypothetical protein
MLLGQRTPLLPPPRRKKFCQAFHHHKRTACKAIQRDPITRTHFLLWKIKIKMEHCFAFQTSATFRGNFWKKKGNVQETLYVQVNLNVESNMCAAVNPVVVPSGIDHVAGHRARAPFPSTSLLGPLYRPRDKFSNDQCS